MIKLNDLLHLTDEQASKAKVKFKATPHKRHNPRYTIGSE